VTWDFVRLFNILEAVYWSLLGVGLWIALRRRPLPIPRTAAYLSVTLLVFGLTDVIEVTTGAWWKPWWLAVLKVACGVVIVFAAARLWRQASVRNGIQNVS